MLHGLSPAVIAADVRLAAHATPAGIAERQAERLALLLEAARRTTMYGRVLRGRDIRHTPLQALPVAHKPTLMRHFHDGVADPQLNLDAVRAFCADPARIGQPLLGRYWVWESSGSTGEPGVFVQDATAMAVYDALESTRRDLLRPWVRLFDPLFASESLAFVGAIEGHFASVVALQRLRRQNPWAAQRWRAFSILQPQAALRAQLDEFEPSIIATYPTAAVLLADAQAAGRLHIAPAEIWTGGETLTAPMRARIESVFGCPLRNSYGSSEFLPIAWECSAGRMHVNADWVILEPVDKAHRPVAAGQVSATTLLTNLANHVQPIIRVDIGDRIAIDEGLCPCGSLLPVVRVQGRADDMLTLPGRDGDTVQLLPLALSTVLEDEAGVFDFELRQTTAAHWRLSLGPGVQATPALRARCRSVLLEFATAQGAGEWELQTRSVKLLALGRSGKLKRVVGRG